MTTLRIALAVLFSFAIAGPTAACSDDASSGVAVVDSGDEAGSAGPDGTGEATKGDGTGPESDRDDGGAGEDGDGSGGEGEDGDTEEPEPATTARSTSGDGSLPGDPFEIGPPAGERLDVVGVRHDDVLNFRERPDPSAPIVDTAAPKSTSPAIVSSGEGRLLTGSAWWKVTVGGEPAWANFQFLGTLGVTDDVLDDLAASLPATSAPTVEDLIDDIAQARAAGPEPDVAFVTPVEGHDGGEAQVTIDVIGIGDDAVKGERFVLTFDREVESVELIGAMRTVICGRGLSGRACI